MSEMITIKVVDILRTGLSLQAAREAAGLTRREVSERLGLSNQNAIYKWEKGLNLPTIDNLINLCDMYGVTVESVVKTAKIRFRREKIV